ncbi:hypothetical protein BDW22DRAFT_1424911 [Trametopsis cervina]|nr:hypothetical protein BDW22DRAFT_1424911 [Trametopsis cervina]
MEELPDDEGIDLQSLQAQIDLTLAQTQNLVASWLKPTAGASSSSASARGNQERDIQELLKRPPRLGVGASVPASTGIRGHETIRLKGKLTGKKRGREQDEGPTAAAVDQSDDEQESRAGAIRKKARVDPFAGGSKGKKKQNTQLQAAEAKTVPLPLPKTNQSGQSPEAEDQAADVQLGSPGKATEPAEASSSQKKKKKKNKRTAAGEHETAISPKQDVTPPFVASQRPLTPPPTGSQPAPVKPSTTQTSATATQKATDQANSLPLLNLAGPPPTPELSPTKKKRKRNKKKKKKVPAEQSGDVDSEAHGEDEEDG